MTEYAKGGRDVRELDRSGGHFSRHMAAMTDENLHDKGDIAAELAWRDARIAELEQRVKVLEDALKCARAESFLLADCLFMETTECIAAQKALEATCQK